ncbi:MAG: hypothetical protein ACRD0G_05865 [Acidimicrobiales bacterium]
MGGPQVRRGAGLAITGVVMWLSGASATAGAQIPDVEVEVEADCEGDLGVKITNGSTTDDLAFAVSVTDVFGTEAAEPNDLDVLAGESETLEWPDGVVNGEELELEDAVVTVTTGAGPGAQSNSLVLNCAAAQINGITAEAICVAEGATNALRITNSRAGAVELTVREGGVIFQGEVASGVKDIAVLRQFPSVVVEHPDGTITVSFAHCPQPQATTSSTTSTTAPASTATTAPPTGTNSAQIADTGKEDEALARLGTTVALVGLVLLLTSKWWLRLWRERETLLADFNQWRLRDR